MIALSHSICVKKKRTDLNVLHFGVIKVKREGINAKKARMTRIIVSGEDLMSTEMDTLQSFFSKKIGESMNISERIVDIKKKENFRLTVTLATTEKNWDLSKRSAKDPMVTIVTY